METIVPQTEITNQWPIPTIHNPINHKTAPLMQKKPTQNNYLVGAPDATHQTPVKERYLMPQKYSKLIYCFLRRLYHLPPSK